MPAQPIALNLALIVYRLLTDPRGWRRDDLIDELELDERTYRKYRQLLRDRFAPFQRSGKPLVAEIADDEGVRWLRLVETEGVAASGFRLVARMAAHRLASEVLRFLGGAGIGTALDDASVEFRARIEGKAFARHLARNLDRMLHCVPDAPKDYAAQSEKIAALLHAIVFTKRVALLYEGWKTKQEVEPLSLVLYRSGLHVFARFRDKTKIYNLVVDRIREVDGLPQHFRYPSEKEYSPAELTEDAFGIFLPPNRERIDVELVFANEKWLKAYLRERRWGADQKVQDLKDGRLRLSFRVSSTVELVPWIRQFARSVEVVRPAGLELGR